MIDCREDTCHTLLTFQPLLTPSPSLPYPPHLRERNLSDPFSPRGQQRVSVRFAFTMPAFKMLSMAAVAAMVMGVAEAFPHPECEECAKVTDAQQESLDLSEKVRAWVWVCRSRGASVDIAGLPCVWWRAFSSPSAERPADVGAFV